MTSPRPNERLAMIFCRRARDAEMDTADLSGLFLVVARDLAILPVKGMRFQRAGRAVNNAPNRHHVFIRMRDRRVCSGSITRPRAAGCDVRRFQATGVG